MSNNKKNNIDIEYVKFYQKKKYIYYLWEIDMRIWKHINIKYLKYSFTSNFVRLEDHCHIIKLMNLFWHIFLYDKKMDSIKKKSYCVIMFFEKYYKYGKLLYAKILFLRDNKKIFFTSYEKNNETNKHLYNQKIDIWKYISFHMFLLIFYTG